MAVVTLSPVLVLVVAMPLYAATSQRNGIVLWRGGYELGWGAWHVQADPGGAVVQTQTVRDGRYAAEFKVGPGDVPIGNSNERSQVYIDQAHTDGYDGREVWYAWSTLIAPGSVLDSGEFNNLTSWHQTGPVCPAPVHVAIDGSTRMLRLDAWGGPLKPEICLNPFRRRWKLGKLDFGKWYDFVFHVRWSPNPKIGLVELWINGRRIIPPTHAATLYTDQGVYLKQGYDRGGANGTAVIYNDATVVAGNYRGAISAFPRGSWPSSPRELPARPK